MSIFDILILLLIAFLFVLALVFIFRKRGQGCGGGCAGCGSRGICPHAANAAQATKKHHTP